MSLCYLSYRQLSSQPLTSILPPRPTSEAQLTRAIRQYDKASWPNLQILSYRQRALKDLTELLNQCSIGRCKLKRFGSTVNGFGTASADLDCMIEIQDVQPGFVDQDTGAIKSRNVLRKVASVISKSDKFSKPQRIITKRVCHPVIKTIHLEHKLDLDITVCNGDQSHLLNSNLLLKYAKSDRRVRSVGRFLGLLMKSTYLGGNFQGGLSSYAYKILLINYLVNVVKVSDLVRMDGMRTISDNLDQPKDTADYDVYKETLFRHPISEDSLLVNDSNSELSEGRLLLGFLLYYALKFDYFNDLVQINNPNSVKKVEQSWNFVIEDPIVELDLGRYLSTPNHLAVLRYYFLFLYQSLGHDERGSVEIVDYYNNLEYMKCGSRRSSWFYSEWVAEGIHYFFFVNH